MHPSLKRAGSALAVLVCSLVVCRERKRKQPGPSWEKGGCLCCPSLCEDMGVCGVGRTCSMAACPPVPSLLGGLPTNQTHTHQKIDHTHASHTHTPEYLAAALAKGASFSVLASLARSSCLPLVLCLRIWLKYESMCSRPSSGLVENLPRARATSRPARDQHSDGSTATHVHPHRGRRRQLRVSLNGAILLVGGGCE